MNLARLSFVMVASATLLSAQSNHQVAVPPAKADTVAKPKAKPLLASAAAGSEKAKPKTVPKTQPAVDLQADPKQTSPTQADSSPKDPPKPGSPTAVPEATELPGRTPNELTPLKDDASMAPAKSLVEQIAAGVTPLPGAMAMPGAQGAASSVAATLNGTAAGRPVATQAKEPVPDATKEAPAAKALADAPPMASAHAPEAAKPTPASLAVAVDKPKPDLVPAPVPTKATERKVGEPKPTKAAPTKPEPVAPVKGKKPVPPAKGKAAPAAVPAAAPTPEPTPDVTGASTPEPEAKPLPGVAIRTPRVHGPVGWTGKAGAYSAKEPPVRAKRDTQVTPAAPTVWSNPLWGGWDKRANGTRHDATSLLAKDPPGTVEGFAANKPILEDTLPRTAWPEGLTRMIESVERRPATLKGHLRAHLQTNSPLGPTLLLWIGPTADAPLSACVMAELHAERAVQTLNLVALHKAAARGDAITLWGMPHLDTESPFEVGTHKASAWELSPVFKAVLDTPAGTLTVTNPDPPRDHQYDWARAKLATGAK
jgi:hypothetical protein